jgi:hypothetical protein
MATVSDHPWRKSSFCESGACIEVRLGAITDMIEIRSTTDDPDDYVLVTAAEYDAFIADVKAGKFDRDKL